MMKLTAYLFFLYLSLVLGQSAVFAQNGDDPVKVVAHRGAHQKVPENTLQAFKKAISLGLDYIEVDLRTSKDGMFVVFHDETLDRMTGVSGRNEDVDWETLRSFPLVYRNKKSSRYRIPTFEEVLDLSQGKVKIYLDFKEAEVEKAWELIEKYQMSEHLIVYANTSEQARKWRAIAPKVPLMMSLPDSVRDERSLAGFLLQTEVQLIDGRCEEYSEQMIREAHNLGVQVWIDIQSSRETPEIWENCLLKGVDALQTDHPRELVKYLKRKKLVAGDKNKKA